VAIGAPFNDGNGTTAGHVRIYEYSAGSWTQLGADIDGEVPGDESGRSVSLSSDGTTVAIGAPYNNGAGAGTDAGHARIYEYSAGSWTQLGADIDGEATGDESGYSVSLSSDGSRVAIGAYKNDGNGTDAGHVRVYSICFDTIQQQPQSNTFYTVPGDAYFTVIHSDTTANYQWQEDTGTGWSDLSDQGIYSGTATDSLILTGITASLNGYEYRCLVDACSMDTTDLATLTVVDNIGIGEVLTDVVVSPNPTSGILNIVLTSLSEYEVFNINGQRVAQGNTEGQIDITNLPTGSYQIIITNDDGRSTHTIQKI
nr:T9SS type A sorting domain-containing protein [Bacteroidota bacterium]